MTRRRYRPSSALDGRRQRIQLDNITLIPASQLPFKDEWTKIAQGLPAHEALLVVPSAEIPLKQVARTLVPQLRARGRHVTAVSTHGLASHITGEAAGV